MLLLRTVNQLANIHLCLGELETALNGTDSQPGLLEIADEYGDDTAAPFFAADALFQLGRYDEAEEYFRRVDLGGLFGASATAGLAAVHEMQGEFEDAGEMYERAARDFPGEATAPGYLLDAARAHLAAGDTEAAESALMRVIDEWEAAPEVRTAAADGTMRESYEESIAMPRLRQYPGESEAIRQARYRQTSSTFWNMDVLRSA